MKKYIFTVIVLVMFISLSAVFDDYSPSPQFRAMGDCGASLSRTADGIFYNPAGLYYSSSNINLNYTHPFDNDFSTLSSVSLVTKLPKYFGAIAFGLESMDIDYLDVDLTSEKTYSIGHSFRLFKDFHSEATLGYTLNFYSLTYEGLGSDNAFGINVGAQATLHQRTHIGFYVENINNPEIIAENSKHDLPQKLSTGISYQPYPGVTTTIELKKSLNKSIALGETEIHSGVELLLFKSLALRMGARNNPNSYSVGLGYNFKNIIFNYSFNTHIMGDTHHFGIGYKY